MQNQTVEGLTAVGSDGRVKPWLAKDWTVSEDGRLLTVALRPGVRFHDGSVASSSVLADILRNTLGQFAGPAFKDVEAIDSPTPDTIAIKLKNPSQFVLESLEAPLAKPGTATVGTGPFMTVGASGPSEIKANGEYYLGPPAISKIDIKEFPTVRTAWAEMLRGNLDMVYELGVDAIDSLQSSTTVDVFSVVRHYQYVIILNTVRPTLKSAAIRRALNLAIDRRTLVDEALNGHGVPSTGPIWPTHWAATPALSAFEFQPQEAADIVAKAAKGHARDHKLQFTCLVASDADRVSLVVKRQLESIGVDLVLKEASRDDLNAAAANGNFDAILTGIISGPSIVRPYLWWYSRGPRNRGGYENRQVDMALENIDHALTDADYRAGVEAFQNAILADPPAIFLAWDERARAVSNRFDVVTQPGTDIVRTLHLWRPVAGAASADKN